MAEPEILLAIAKQGKAWFTEPGSPGVRWPQVWLGAGVCGALCPLGRGPLQRGGGTLADCVTGLTCHPQCLVAPLSWPGLLLGSILHGGPWWLRARIQAQQRERERLSSQQAFRAVWTGSVSLGWRVWFSVCPGPVMSPSTPFLDH